MHNVDLVYNLTQNDFLRLRLLRFSWIFKTYNKSKHLKANSNHEEAFYETAGWTQHQPFSRISTDTQQQSNSAIVLRLEWCKNMMQEQHNQ